jgi:PAS domain S-box-containing protein
LELSAIRELMQKVRAATTLDDALNSILDIVASLVWSDESSLLTVDEGQETMTVRAARGQRAAAKIGREVFALGGDSIVARALRERGALIASQAEDGADGPQSQLALPLVVGDELIGVLTMESETPDLYTEESVKMLHLVASQAATIYREMNSLRTLTRYTDNILRSIAAGVITVDKHGYIVTWNRRAAEIMNLRAHQIVGRHYSEFIQMLQVDSSVREETMRMLEMTAQTGKVFTGKQLCYVAPQGGETYVNLSASQLKSESGEYLGVVLVFEDVTNEVQMKEEMERVSKLAETGQLAANIAHELRNPLSSIKGAAQLLRNELPSDYVQQHGEFLDIIVEEVNGLNRMTSEFLEFSRATPPEMASLNINTVVSRLLQFMSTYLTAQEIILCQALDEDVPDLWLDKMQIEQVIKNIVINAAQAMPHGGYLTVATRFFSASGIAEVSFTDTGVGISPEKMEKIWTPFFTTKTKGTGLGLAIARKIVETHSGRLNVRTTPGQGSTFTIHLPVNPLRNDLVLQSGTEITEQRSDQPGELYGMPHIYASDE